VSVRGRATFDTMMVGATYELRAATQLSNRRSKVAVVGSYVTARSPSHGYPGDRDWVCDIVGAGGNVIGHIVVHPSKLRYVSPLEVLAALTTPSADEPAQAPTRPPGASPR